MTTLEEVEIERLQKEVVDLKAENAGLLEENTKLHEYQDRVREIEGDFYG